MNFIRILSTMYLSLSLSFTLYQIVQKFVHDTISRYRPRWYLFIKYKEFHYESKLFWTLWPFFVIVIFDQDCKNNIFLLNFTETLDFYFIYLLCQNVWNVSPDMRAIVITYKRWSDGTHTHIKVLQNRDSSALANLTSLQSGKRNILKFQLDIEILVG